MLGKIFTFTLVVFILSTTASFAQTSAVSFDDNLLASISTSEIMDDSWLLYTDEENELLYIDFESIDVNLSTIIVKSKDNKVLIKEDVLDLPVNTIFEIDFSEFGPGKYTVEMQSFIGAVTRVVEIK